MKVEAKNENGTSQHLEVTSLVITFSNGETIEISDVKENYSAPHHLPDGVIVWGGTIPKNDASLDEHKASTRGLGIHPLAANMILLFPRAFNK